MCVRPEYSARLVSGETSFYEEEEAAYPVCSMDHQVGPAFLYSVIWSINKSFQDPEGKVYETSSFTVVPPLPFP